MSFDSSPRDRVALLVYDQECPFCDAYCRLVRIRKAAGTLTLVNARDQSPLMEEITRLGLDIDQGMALKVGDTIYYGADAICALALMSSNSGVFNRMNYWIFRSKNISRVFYPVLRSCRNLALKILGKTKVNNLSLPDNRYF